MLLLETVPDVAMKCSKTAFGGVFAQTSLFENVVLLKLVTNTSFKGPIRLLKIFKSDIVHRNCTSRCYKMYKTTAVYFYTHKRFFDSMMIVDFVTNNFFQRRLSKITATYSCESFSLLRQTLE